MTAVSGDEMSEPTRTLPSWITGRTAGNTRFRDFLIVVNASIVIAVAAQLSVPLPFTPVPMTLQPMAILLVGALLGSTRGFAAAALYLFEGAIGLPVFANGKAGLFWLVAGPTAGYLLSYPIVAWVTGRLSEKGWTRSPLRTVAMMTIGLAMIHLFGWSWLASMMGLGPKQAFLAGTAPFITGDLVKIALAAVLLPSLQKYLDFRHRKD